MLHRLRALDWLGDRQAIPEIEGVLRGERQAVHFSAEAAGRRHPSAGDAVCMAWRSGQVLSARRVGKSDSLSVIVPYRNEVSHIGACCEALERQSLRRDHYELLFVDNRSTDGTSEAIRSAPGVTLIREERPGSYVARNAAQIRAAQTFRLQVRSEINPTVRLQSVDNRVAVGGRLAVPAFLLAPTKVGQALPYTARVQPCAA